MLADIRVHNCYKLSEIVCWDIPITAEAILCKSSDKAQTRLVQICNCEDAETGHAHYLSLWSCLLVERDLY